MEIKIKGEIGWDVFANDIERQLRYADGDVTVLLDTPGGGVYEGISIYNALKNYTKGKVTIHVTGLCASMGSYIVLSSPNRIFEPNAVVMIHNPSGAIRGDYQEVQNYGVLLEKLANLFRNKYVEEIDFSYEAIKNMMDITTYFIGKEELQAWGEVLESKISETETDADILKASAKERIDALNAKMTKDYVKADLDKVAKMLLPSSGITMTTDVTNINNTRLEKQEEKMDLNELKNKYPDIYNQVKQEGYQDGVKAGTDNERKRVQDHMQFMDIDNAKDLVTEAIKDGIPFTDMFAKYTRLSLNDKEIKNMQTNSPKDVNPSEANEFQTGGISATEKPIVDEIEKGLATSGLWEVK